MVARANKAKADPAAEPRPTEGGRGKGVTRQAILDCAQEVFAELGYQSANLLHVANRLGVTRQALYYHYARKQDILLALLERMMDVLEAGFDEIVASDPPRDDLFPLLLQNHAEIVAANMDLVTTLMTENTAFADESFERAQERRRAYTERFVAAYRQGVRAGSLRDMNAGIAVHLLLGANNAIFRWYEPSGPIPPEEIARFATNLFRYGFGGETGDAAAGRAAEPVKAGRGPRRTAGRSR